MNPNLNNFPFIALAFGTFSNVSKAKSETLLNTDFGVSADLRDLFTGKKLHQKISSLRLDVHLRTSIVYGATRELIAWNSLEIACPFVRPCQSQRVSFHFEWKATISSTSVELSIFLSFWLHFRFHLHSLSLAIILPRFFGRDKEKMEFICLAQVTISIPHL